MSAYDALPDAVIVVDSAGAVVDANLAARELLGDGHTLRGITLADLEPRDAHRRPLDVAAVVDARRAVECTLRRPNDGGDVSLSLTGRAGGDDTVVLCGRPESDHSGIAVVSTVSHELRSPLTSVKGYVALLLSRWDRLDDDAKRDMLRQVNHDADRVTRLIGELLDISRIEAGRLTLRRQNIDLAEIAQRVVDKVAIAHPDLDARLDLSALPEVYADPDKIEQVLTNLVENGAKYGNPVGLTVTGDSDGETVTITVTDRGPGIPEPDIPKLFDKFFRRDHGRPDGTGLGLWISRGLVEAHGGDVRVASEVGEYTSFTFTLPERAFDAVHH